MGKLYMSWRDIGYLAMTCAIPLVYGSLVFDLDKEGEDDDEFWRLKTECENRSRTYRSISSERARTDTVADSPETPSGKPEIKA